MIGVAALICVLSVIDGFEDGLRKRFLAANAHILMYKYPGGVTNAEEAVRLIGAKLAKQTTGVAPFVYFESVLTHNFANAPVIVRGIEPHRREAIQSLKEIVTPLSALDALQEEMDQPDLQSPYKAIVGSMVLADINAKIGDVIKITSPTQSASGGYDQSSLEIVGVYDSGFNHYDRKIVITSVRGGQRLLKIPHVTGLEIGLHDPSISPQIAQLLSESHPEFSITEWQSFNRPMFQMVEKQRSVIALLVFLVSLVASLNILSTMFVSVTQKQRDISLLRALGASNRQVLRLFLNQSVIMGLIGVLLGCTLAALINHLLGNYDFIKLPDAYFLRSLPVKNDPAVYGGVAVVAMALSVIAALGPSLAASRGDPSAGLSEKG